MYVKDKKDDADKGCNLIGNFKSKKMTVIMEILKVGK